MSSHPGGDRSGPDAGPDAEAAAQRDVSHRWHGSVGVRAEVALAGVVVVVAGVAWATAGSSSPDDGGAPPHPRLRAIAPGYRFQRSKHTERVSCVWFGVMTDLHPRKMDFHFDEAPVPFL